MVSVSVAIFSSLIITSFGNEWSYDDVDNWANLVMTDGSTNYCATSYHTQSPININTAGLSSCPSSDSQLDWQLNNEINNFKVLNNGHNLAINPVINGDDDSRLGVLKHNFGGSYDEYCLDGFHLHWGLNDNAGSEHKINNLGKTVELHFVHYSCQYNSLQAALVAAQDESVSDKYVLAVVAILFEIGQENTFLSKITDNISSLLDEDNEIAISSADMTQLIPSNALLNDYYYYKGSLTTPTCNPVVQWYVLRNAMTISPSQIAELRKVRDTHEHLSAPCVRPTQTNINTVHHCQNAADSDDSGDSE